MKRKILLFMMTALLSVGAWAQNLWTKTLWTGEKTVTSSDPLTIAKSELQGARVGSQICIYLSLSGDAEWGYNINYYGSSWKTTWSGKGDNLVVSAYIDNDILSYDNPLNIYAKDQDNTTPTCTVTKVTLNYNGANLLTNAEGWDPNWNGTQLKCSNASEGDVLAVAIKANSITYWWGTANGKLYLQSATGNPEATDDTDLYTENEALTGSGVTIAGSVFTGIVEGDKLAFSGTGDGDGKTITVTSNDVELGNNPWWYNVTIDVTSSNIETIKTYGVVVTGAVGTLAKVTKQSIPEGRPTGYCYYEKFSENATLYIPLTSELASYAQADKLYIGGWGYTVTSVDLIYAPIELANDADNATTISNWQSILTNVTLAGRTLTKSGDWNTLCLPFAVSAEQLAVSTNPLYGATIKELNAETSSLADGTLTLNFTDASSIEAGKPYIVKWASGENVSNPLFEGVTITVTEPTAVEFSNANGSNCKFVGQFKPFDINAGNIDEIIMLGSGSKLGYSKNARELKTFRAHFEVPGRAAARAFVMNFGDEETTGIISVQGSGSMVNGSDAWYSLGGQRLQGAPTAKGVYIQNGRKVVVK